MGEKVEPRGRTYTAEVDNSDSKTKKRRIETQEVDPSTLSSTELTTYIARRVQSGIDRHVAKVSNSRSEDTDPKKKWPCHVCGKLGHWAHECRNRGKPKNGRQDGKGKGKGKGRDFNFKSSSGKSKGRKGKGKGRTTTNDAVGAAPY